MIFTPTTHCSLKLFYNTSDFTQAKKIYKKMSKQGEAFLWYSSKQNAKIFIKEDKSRGY